VHIDRRLPTNVFDSAYINRLVQGARNLFLPASKRTRLPITRNVLLKLLLPYASIREAETTIINTNTAFALAFTAFLRIGEFTYTKKQAKRTVEFEAIKLTRSDVKFSENFNHITLTLKRSKTDRLNQGVNIVIAATSNAACLVRALRQLFDQDP